jgi:hypothetical protein
MKRLGWCLVAVGILLAAIRLWGHYHGQSLRDWDAVRLAQEQSELAHFDARRARQQRDSVVAENLRLERRLAMARQQVDTALVAGAAAADSARTVLADSSANISRLRSTVASLLLSQDSLSASFRRYLAADSTVHYRWGVERDASTVALDKAESAYVALEAVNAALRKSATCRIMVFPCPTRTQAVVGGLILGAVVATQLPRP